MSLIVSPLHSTVQGTGLAAKTSQPTSRSLFSGESTKTENPSADNKEPVGTKSPNWRKNFIQKMKENYKITEGTEFSFSLNKNIKVYYIEAKADVNLATLRNDLGIAPGVISNCNEGYGQYDNNGHHIDNKPMKNVKIKIPVEDLGKTIEERGLLERALDWFRDVI